MARTDEQDLSVRWTRRLTLRQRILAVNIFAIAILAGAILYLDGFRSRLTQARIDQSGTEVIMIAHALAHVAPEQREHLLIRLGQDSRARLRIYRSDGARLADSWNNAPPTYEMRNPDEEPFMRGVARALDNGFDWLVGAHVPAPLVIAGDDDLADWPEANVALQQRALTTALRRAPEGTPFISAAAPIANDAVLLFTVNAREIRRVVRAERLTLAIIIGLVILLSMLLSRFLARTIALPLRRLALAAHRVRLGRSREVDVPRLPDRRDEIGLLARALHDMTHSLRRRIDATEAFAADVTHELKNPLASLRSAVDSMERVQDPDLQKQLLDIIRHDVKRLDRLVVDIAETSRVDAELSRARFEPIDLGALIGAMLPGWQIAEEKGVKLAFVPPAPAVIVQGDESRLARLIDNLVGNAISFSPEGGTVAIVVGKQGEEAFVAVEDEGPGVPEHQRPLIFNRFHSVRPDEDFGRHSGLGLSISKAIAEGHGGRLAVEGRRDGRSGARFTFFIPTSGA